MQQAWCDVDMSTEVTNEDILAVDAKKVLLQPREPVSPARSFAVGAWQPHDGKVPPSPVKSIHHFCVLPDGLQLPHPYRGVWQQHHRQMSSLVSDFAQLFIYSNKCS